VRRLFFNNRQNGAVVSFPSEATYVSTVGFAIRESPASVSRKSSTVVFIRCEDQERCPLYRRGDSRLR
jgi:hypothetical protein